MKNEVNRALVAKKTKYIVLGLLMSMTLSVNARVFEAGERLYINMEAQSVKDAGDDLQYGWYSTYNNYNYAYFYKGSTNGWSTKVQQYAGTVWYVEAPAGDWDYVILTRHTSANASWSNVKTQTGDIWFYYYDKGELKMREQNYIQNFYYDDGGTKNGANWEYVAPSPSGNPATWSLPAEDEQICTSAAGTEYSLRVKNGDYANTYAHAWFIYENNKWTRLQGEEWRTSELDRDYVVTLGAAYSDVYYFLQASRPSMCRLIHMRLNQDCSEGAPGACKITSFVAVSSDANVTDQTSAINGVVAFDDKVNAGQLQIWSPDIDTIIINNEDIETPQTFKLKGFDASTSKTYTLYAKFLGDATGECEASCSVTVTPPPVSPIVHTTTGTAADPRLVRFTEEDVTLTPDNQTSTYFQWTNSVNEDKIIDTIPANRNLTFTAPIEEQTIEYVFLATQDPPEPAGNLIVNGDMEYDGNFTSSYTYWGIDIHEFPTYDDPTKSEEEKSGGYTLTQDAHYFYHTYNVVTPHHGTYFGLFDSKRNGVNQAAWVASTADNPNLKVEAGVSYMFSFWVANVNNFGEMDNGAQLQFQISYNGGSTWHNLGSMIDLSNYRDNRWHGISSIATPSESSSNVMIRVINMHSSSENRGNDFALDDIRFEAITANTANIAALERFPVTYLKCVIDTATFEQRQPIGCGTTVADVDYTVHFIHPRGDLYIYEGTTLLAHIPHSVIGDETTSYTGVIAAQSVDNADHVLTVYFDDTHVKTDAPTTYTYNAKAVPAISVKSTTWGEPSCDVSTVTLTAVIQYTNQNGTLTANVDGEADIPSQQYTVESDDENEVTLVIPGVSADGNTGHKLNVNFDGSHGCSIVDFDIADVAPVVPTIDTLHISFSDPGCTELTTTLTFDLDYTYQRGTMTYWVDAMPKQTATYTIDDPTKQTLTGLTVANIPADGKNNHVLHVSFDGTNSCVKDYALSTVPFSPVISSVTVSVPATVQCKDNDYPVSVSLVTPYDATGRNIVLSGSKDTTIVATGTSTTVAFKLTDIGAAVSHTVIAAYEATPTCTTSSTPFTPPTRVSCEKLDTTICEGQTVTWKGTVYSGTVGQTDTIVVGLDSLILTVYAVPAITIQPMDMFCDNEANILIPFKTTAGNPDMFDVVINDVHYAGTAVGSDISFPRGAELVAGDYTATVTVGESGSDCSSQATVNFTLAAGDLMYSKWTDVLFISNADGRFVSYQWYKNGSLMYGETQQRLYYSKGLRGTYQCVMTTKEGKTIYTCPQDFEDVQPSRSAGPEPNKVQTEMYDAMGRTIKGQPSKGIYVVIEEIDGERTAKKIIVSE